MTAESPAAARPRQPPSSSCSARLDLRRRLRDRSILLQVFLAPILLALIVGGAFAGESGLPSDHPDRRRGPDRHLGHHRGSDRRRHSTKAVGVVFLPATVADGRPRPRQAVGVATRCAAVVISGRLHRGRCLRRNRATLVVIGEAGDAIVTGVAPSVADGIAARLQIRHGSVHDHGRRYGRGTGGADRPGRTGHRAAAPADHRVSDSRVENTFSIMAFFAPGMAMIFLFFVMGAAARSLLTERREGTLNRVLAGPTSATGVLLGKTDRRSSCSALLSHADRLPRHHCSLFGVDWGDPIGVLLVIVCRRRSHRRVLADHHWSGPQRGTGRGADHHRHAVAGVFGGTFVYSATGCSPKLRAFTPNGQALMAFIDLSAGEASWVDVLPRVLIILAIRRGDAAPSAWLAIRRGMQQ